MIVARVLGREIARITGRNTNFNLRIRNLLEANTQSPASSTLAIIMNEYIDKTVEDCILLVREIQHGMIEIHLDD